MNGPMSGTPIQDLQNMQQIHYNANHNYQHEQGHNAAHHMHQAQHMPYNQMNTCSGYPSYNRPPQQDYVNYNQHSSPHAPNQLHPPNQLQQQDIEDLVKDINENIPEDTFEPLENTEETKKEADTVLSFVPKEFREPLIVLVLYVLLSQQVIQETLGKYIEQINPDNDCVVPMVGRIIYGVILAVLYYAAKQFLL